MKSWCALAAVALLQLTAAPVHSVDYVAGPDDYLHNLETLVPGDTLTLRAGIYRWGLPVHGLNGAPAHRIIIQGPRAGPPAVLLGRDDANTVSLVDASYITIRNLRIDGAHLPVDGIKAEGRGGPVHHITLERLTIINHDFAQDIIAISTKRPAWGWVIRDNTIIGAGTGMYLGDSNGTAAFFDGMIENNLIVDTIGYNIEIKQQVERPSLPGAPTTPSVTVLRHNVFAKTRNASSGEAARPNVLVGHWPPVGAGSDDRYDIVGNVFFDNPTEALFQGEGNVTLSRNIFFNPHGEAIVIQPHHGVPRRISVAQNFIAGSERGVWVEGGAPDQVQEIVDNEIFAGEPLTGGTQRGNKTGVFAQAWPALRRWTAHARISGSDNAVDQVSLAAAKGKACTTIMSERDNTQPLPRGAPAHPLCSFLQMLNHFSK
jgi:hypothetical protein